MSELGVDPVDVAVRAAELVPVQPRTRRHLRGTERGSFPLLGGRRSARFDVALHDDERNSGSPSVDLTAAS